MPEPETIFEKRTKNHIKKCEYMIEVLELHQMELIAKLAELEKEKVKYKKDLQDLQERRWGEAK